jgi:RluA family pseudouridine synthase
MVSPHRTASFADRSAASTAADLRRRVLFRDERVIVLDKPAGLPVHAGPRGGVSIEDLLPQLADHPGRVPMLAHRLDRDTGGCLVLARRRSALRALMALFADGTIDKTYWAVVRGQPPSDSGTVAAPLKKIANKSGWRMAVDPSGQAAVTGYRLLGRSADLAWLELKPRTGRTHQVRVHCAALGCPILGDPLYGAAEGAAPLHLLARRVEIPSQPGAPAIAATAPMPEALRAAFAACGWREAPAPMADAGRSTGR